MKNTRLLSLALSAAGVLAASSLLLGASGFAGGRDLPLPTTTGKCANRCTEKVAACVTDCLGGPDGGDEGNNGNPGETRCVQRCQEQLAPCVERCTK